MNCYRCGEGIMRKARNADDGYVILGRYLLVKSGSLIAACPKCGTHVHLLKSKPLLLKVDR